MGDAPWGLLPLLYIFRKPFSWATFTCRLYASILYTYGVVAEWLARSTRVRKDTGSNPAEAGHYVTTVGKLFTPTVPSRAEGRLNQLAHGTAVPL